VALWHPKAVRRIHLDAGGFQGGGRKLVWHTTEGTSLPNYGGSAPHFTLDPADGRLWQHIPLDRAARALMAGGPNFWNTVQVELIGFADTARANQLGVPERAVVNWPAGHYTAIAGLARWIESNFAVPRKCTVEFVDHASHLGSLDAVKGYAGHIGHQHIVGNDHWDPGLLKIDLILGDAADTADDGPAARDLARGDRGTDVEAVQAILVKRGYAELPAKARGMFGRETEAYVVHFQWKHGLKVDGVVGEGTRTALGLELDPSPPGKKGKPKLRELPGLELGRGKPLEGHVHMPEDGSAGRIDKKSLLLAAPRATLAQLEAYIGSRPHGSYDDAKVKMIVGLYVKTATSVGLDPLLVVAQMIFETGNLTSDWSQPPRRNPAGIGVTGVPGEGLSFPTWRAAVRAHVGRLLAYCVAKGAETPAQRKLIDEALTWRPLPDTLRGGVTNVSGLAGTWAADKQYAVKIVRVAAEIARPAS
jgi:peptidoglycan hydrolase-like protein with peptidoglycan-binding domain